MPVYQYECRPCLVVYEVLHGMNDPPLNSCRRCGGSVTRLISAPRINRHNFSGPTEAKYAKVSPQQEVAQGTRSAKGLRADLAAAAGQARAMGLRWGRRLRR
jgi:putative FmdB family regulatory protein